MDCTLTTQSQHQLPASFSFASIIGDFMVSRVWDIINLEIEREDDISV